MMEKNCNYWRRVKWSSFIDTVEYCLENNHIVEKADESEIGIKGSKSMIQIETEKVKNKH